jgi:hypothetical protein
MATHENLAAGLIGAGGALFAAWLAYSAVQQQLVRQDYERERLQKEAKVAAVMALTQSVHAAASTLSVIRKALQYEELMLIAAHFDDIDFGMKQLAMALDHWSLREVARDLPEADRAAYLMTVLTLGSIANIASQKKSPQGDATLRLQEQKRALESAHTYLYAFDADLAEVYEREGGM